MTTHKVPGICYSHSWVRRGQNDGEPLVTDACFLRKPIFGIITARAGDAPLLFRTTQLCKLVNHSTLLCLVWGGHNDTVKRTQYFKNIFTQRSSRCFCSKLVCHTQKCIFFEARPNNKKSFNRPLKDKSLFLPLFSRRAERDWESRITMA